VIPAVDILGGRCVFLTGGRPDTATPVSDDPVALAREWQERGANRLHAVDLDAALGQGDNRNVLRSLLREVTIPVQVGGGLRDESSLREVLAFGAAKAIVGTRAIRDRSWLADMAVRFPSRLVLALDRDARGVLVDGWTRADRVDPRELIDAANRLPLDGVLFTDVAREGRLQGVGKPDVMLVRRCARSRIASGGVSSLEDLRTLRRAGYDHVVVGKALYTGDLEFREAQEIVP
jgi:phosphoribosylformimino-5-aminoimidazole carboxamide ribotide isomerase